MQNFQAADTAQIPVQATPIRTGILGQSPDGTIRGGGGVESFAFTSKLTGKGHNAGFATVSTDRRYSLCDIAGCSSAFFAGALLNYINTVILQDILDEIAKILKEDGYSQPVIDFIVGLVRVTLQYFADLGASEIIPQYNYWPLGEVDQSAPANVAYGFSDGDFENTGILGLLAQTGANRVVAFVNCETPLSADTSSNDVLVDGQIALLFGYKADPVGGTYQSYGGMHPNEPMSYAQVFSDAGGEFAKLRQGLFGASTGGTDHAADLGTDTAAFLQTLTTVDNPVANIKAGRQIKVLWVYNNRVNKWQDGIGSATIQADLQQGQASTNPSGSLANFPHYDTGLQIELDAEAVNMLAQLSAWNAQQLQDQIDQLLT